MATSTTISVEVEPAAAARIDQLGMRQEFSQMLEYLKNNVPGLWCIRVELDKEANMWDEASIVINTYHPAPVIASVEDPSSSSWGTWLGEKFSADVRRHFVRLSQYEGPHGR
jgi:hypothetical protein